MNVAVIPARGGSKRIPRKNIVDFAGKPMIAHSIDTAKSTDLFSEIIVSTDDPEIADIAMRHGASVPFLRPAALSDDYTGTDAVVAHALDWLTKNGRQLDFACCVYATAPLMKPEFLRKGYDLLQSGNWSYVFSAGRVDIPVFRSFSGIQGGGLEMLFPEYRQTRSQDLPPVFYDAGQFYWGRVEAWRQLVPIFSHVSTIVEIPSSHLQDVDTLEDLQAAAAKYDLIRESQDQPSPRQLEN